MQQLDLKKSFMFFGQPLQLNVAMCKSLMKKRRSKHQLKNCAIKNV
jgi:hypothetical protein